MGMSSWSSLTCHLFQGACTVHSPSVCTGLPDRSFCLNTEGPLQEVLFSMYDTGEPPLGLANFHEILTISLLEKSKPTSPSRMSRPTKRGTAPNADTSDGDHSSCL